MALLNVLPQLLPSPRPSQVTTAQEQPYHPLPSVGSSVQAVVGVPAVTRSVYTTQEQPDFAHAIVEMSIPGPNQASLPLVDQYTYTTQEQPDFSPGWAKIGLPPTVAAITLPAVNRLVLTTQEKPDEPFTQVVMAIPGPNQAPPPFSTIATIQELPESARGFVTLWSHPPSAPAVTPVPPVDQYTYVVQELPFHPGPFAKSGVQPPANFVSPAVSTEVFTTQEQPFHPGPWAKAGVPPPANFVSPTISTEVYTVQEFPYHPLPPTFVQFIPHPVTPVPPSTSYITTVQEAPYHPGSFALPWPGPHAVPGIPPIIPIPATYYMLEDHWINQQYLPAGTIQTTADLGGALPINWVPTANVDPVDTNAVAAYTAAGFQRRGLTRQQFTPLPVRQPNYDWQIINNEPVLVKVRNNF